MEIGITGLPQSGKTTLFNALTGGTVATGAYSKEEHLGTVKVPDERLEALGRMFEPKKVTPVDVQYVDVAGLVKSGSRDEKNALLSALRSVDALILVVRAFESDIVSAPDGGIDPVRDCADFELELLFADLEICERRIDRLQREVKVGRTEGKTELDALVRCKEALNAERPLREVEFSTVEEKSIRGFQFLSAKPIIIVMNVAEGDVASASDLHVKWSPLADRSNVGLVVLCAEIEMEIGQLDADDQTGFLEDLGIPEPAVSRLIRESYSLLDLITFFTAGGQDEARAWSLPKGSLAPQAAGAIHSDLERGFIRAEVVRVQDLLECGSFVTAKEKALLRLEGKAYEVQEGDVLTIRFSV